MADIRRVKNGLTGIYNASLTTLTALTDGDGSAIQLDQYGRVIVVNTDGTNVGSSSADGSTFTQNTTTGNISMGVYVSSPQTLTTGKAGAMAIDVNRNLMVTQATLLAGEDLTVGVMKVEQRFSYVYCAGTDTSVKSGPGFLHTLTFAQIDAAPTAGTIIVYDNTAESGTIIFSSTWTTAIFYPTTVTIDTSFSTGLYVGFTTTNDIGVTVSYR